MGIGCEQVASKQSLVEELCCPVCTDLLDPEQAIQTPCGHVYCAQCLSQAQRNSQRCPVCADILPKRCPALRKANMPLCRILGRVRVKCGSPCSWRGELSELATHRRKCAYVQVTCSRCQQCVPRGMLQFHSHEGQRLIAKIPDAELRRALQLEFARCSTVVAAYQLEKIALAESTAGTV